MAPQTDFAITKEKVRAPREHGQTLVKPPLGDVATVWQNNLSKVAGHVTRIGDTPLKSLRSQAREDLLKLATSYSRQYRDVQTPHSSQIIMSGHQPRLFHAGVWFKNFVLSKIANQLSAIAINLVIDNDLCGLSTVSVPQSINKTNATTKSVAYDAAGSNLPFEVRSITDRTTFDSFAHRLGNSISSTVHNPLAHRLWEYAQGYTDSRLRLGHTLAAARHRLEADENLSTLEVPLSVLCQTKEFSRFTSEILLRLDEFRTIYNQAIHAYREVHRIRSQSHPVPELESGDDWQETPFWIWSATNPVRRALYLKRQGNRLLLSNRKDIQLEVEQHNLASQLTELNQKQFAIRPRALITTMYSRFILSDLFIHGIGGAKYDQLTDSIIQSFWNCVPPQFLTVTATMKLPFDFERVEERDITIADQRLRELRFHPENSIDSQNPDVLALIACKQRWIKSAQVDGSNQKRHNAIESCNEQLYAYVQPLANEIRENKATQRSLLARTRVLDSRGYSFCCFDEQLMPELKRMAEL